MTNGSKRWLLSSEVKCIGRASACGGTHRTPVRPYRWHDPIAEGSHRTAQPSSRRRAHGAGATSRADAGRSRHTTRRRDCGEGLPEPRVSPFVVCRGEGRDVVSIIASHSRGFHKPQNGRSPSAFGSPLDRPTGRSCGGWMARMSVRCHFCHPTPRSIRSDAF